jgi:carbon-monoxide dehydrogenase medium subunit
LVGLGPTPIRAKAAEQMLLGQAIDKCDLQAVAGRASAEYRRTVGRRIFVRTLREPLTGVELA